MVKRKLSDYLNTNTNTQGRKGMERKVITVKVKRNNNVKELSEKILKPLLDIIYQYKSSQAYSYIPQTEKDGWDYYEDKFKELYATLDSMIELNEETYERVRDVISEIHTFARQYSYAEGLPERYFRLNPNLRYYIVAYGLLADCKIENFAESVVNRRFKYVPTCDEIKNRDTYFEEKELENIERNLKYTEEDFFMEEVAMALRKAFRLAIA